MAEVIELSPPPDPRDRGGKLRTRHEFGQDGGPCGHDEGVADPDDVDRRVPGGGVAHGAARAVNTTGVGSGAGGRNARPTVRVRP